jgi:hypothetical protein
MDAFFLTQNMEGVELVDFKAKAGYRVLYNGDIVGLDDDGNPTTEPFTGYVFDEHIKLAAELRAEDGIERKLRQPRILKSEKWPQ